MKNPIRNQIMLAACVLGVAMATMPSAAQVRGADDRWKPQTQIAAFRAFVPRYIRQTVGTGVSDLDLKPDAFEILVMDDLNEDSRLDFITFHQSPGFCGSGGCHMIVFLATDDGSYKEVLTLLGPFDAARPDGEDQGPEGYYRVLFFGGPYSGLERLPLER